jgi:hypothetical protein
LLDGRESKIIGIGGGDGAVAREEEEKGGGGQKSPVEEGPEGATNSKGGLQVGGPMAPWLGKRRKKAVREAKMDTPDTAVSG